MRIVFFAWVLFGIAMGAPNIQVVPQKQKIPQTGNLNVSIVPAQKQNLAKQKNQIQYNVIPANPNIEQQNKIQQNIQITPAPTQSPQTNQIYDLNIRVKKNKQISQDMMFYKVFPKKKPKNPPTTIVVPPPQPEEEEDNDRVSLFDKNKDGVMLSIGLGMNISKLWFSNTNDDIVMYRFPLAYYFRVGYQQYINDFLGFRGYAQVGMWSFSVSENVQSGDRSVAIKGSETIAPMAFGEILYDFYNGKAISLGIFGGLGLGYGMYAISNDNTDTKKSTYFLPMLSLGTAFTITQNHRIELDFKSPLVLGTIESNFITKFSSMSYTISYTYIF